MPGQHLVGHGAEGVDIGPVVDRWISGGLLGGHVRRRPHRDPGRGEPARPGLPGSFTQRLGYAEVGDQGVVPAHQHVVGLDVPVQDPLVVGIGQRVDHVAQITHRFRHRQLTLAGELGPQGLALDKGHCVVEQIARAAGCEEGDDVGVLQLRGELDLAPEPLDVDRRRELGR